MGSVERQTNIHSYKLTYTVHTHFSENIFNKSGMHPCTAGSKKQAKKYKIIGPSTFTLIGMITNIINYQSVIEYSSTKFYTQFRLSGLDFSNY